MQRDSLKAQFLRDATRPDQSAAMTDYLALVDKLDDATFENWFLPMMAAKAKAEAA